MTSNRPTGRASADPDLPIGDSEAMVRGDRHGRHESHVEIPSGLDAWGVSGDGLKPLNSIQAGEPEIGCSELREVSSPRARERQDRDRPGWSSRGLRDS
jgi:hypothetical protein